MRPITQTLERLCLKSNHVRAMAWAFALALAVAGSVLPTPASALDAIVEKKSFTLPAYTTQGGAPLKDVKIGWEAYGTLNADKSNVILVTHFFSGSSHAAGKYKADDKVAGYWDAIIGPGKPLDTDKYYIISSDTLVNLNAYDPNVITTGPASLQPGTDKPYGMSFPVVGIRDFVNVQKALLESLGITRLHAVAGASMGALQAYEWASSYPEMVGRIIPVIGASETSGWLIALLDAWGAPIRVDANWNNGDYYGRTPPKAGLTQALKMVTLWAGYWTWVDDTFGRKWAEPQQDPAAAMGNRFLVESTIDKISAARAELSDANHLLYLVKANQLFVAGGDAAVSRIKAPVLLISTDEDLVFPPPVIAKTAERVRAGGAKVEQVKIGGGRGHLNGVVNISEAGDAIRTFLAK
ncbi:homoserine O-acetyltransferase [Azorhizobium caulinodans ORS 571]|uniref:Probable acyltransferase n=1 Tax=Azorhizobium caulinodans (strain ATCC 43989 / DSM 5975 / JCM 20966 / LMG 6465 / NBRC 14845 / NCIMB 13405 / ORS 571) TaxID=438753 RepID=A8I5W3_AZOC5|nr:homoserine O-acetyltransferase [Azorhizobium caulinodans]BAF88328.1 homoserine O-acetyltransferase [Azorhizobium caulinodans ORS 571]